MLLFASISGLFISLMLVVETLAVFTFVVSLLIALFTKVDRTWSLVKCSLGLSLVCGVLLLILR